VQVRALHLGGRPDTHSLEPEGAIATPPLTVRLGNGIAFLFWYGVAVLVDGWPDAEQKLLAMLRPRIVDPFEPIEIRAGYHQYPS
jgi:hypothetical protein